MAKITIELSGELTRRNIARLINASQHLGAGDDTKVAINEALNNENGASLVVEIDLKGAE